MTLSIYDQWRLMTPEEHAESLDVSPEVLVDTYDDDFDNQVADQDHVLILNPFSGDGSYVSAYRDSVPLTGDR